jgi:hypothetical protein
MADAVGLIGPWLVGFPDSGQPARRLVSRGPRRVLRKATGISSLCGHNSESVSSLVADLAVLQDDSSGISKRVAITITGHKTRSVFDRYHIIAPSDLRDAATKLETSQGWNASLSKSPARSSLGRLWASWPKIATKMGHRPTSNSTRLCFLTDCPASGLSGARRRNRTVTSC